MEYKINCQFSNICFDADRKLQYRIVRTEMAKLNEEYSKTFGPVEVDLSLTPDLIKGRLVANPRPY